MKLDIAFVHCWIKPWWALNVLKDLIKPYLWQKILVFTLFSDRDYILLDNKKVKVIYLFPKFLNDLFLNKSQWSFLQKFFDYRNLLPIFPILIHFLSKKINRNVYKKIIISSFAVSKNIKIKKDVKSLLYLHSPMQYIHTHFEDYIKNLSSFKSFLLKFFRKFLLKWDLKKRFFTKVIANSKYTAWLAKQLYWFDKIDIYYPKLPEEVLNLKFKNYIIKDYFIFVGRVANLIRKVDLVIKLFNELKYNLLIVWNWPDLINCKKIAWPTITFIPWIDDQIILSDLIWQSRWFVNLSKESFWLSTLHSLYLGVPVFWLNDWWTKELVNSQSWILVNSLDFKNLKKKLEIFANTNFDRKNIHQHSLNFINKKFIKF